ncbi:MAG: hypothetical protein ACYTA3_11390 [Planctomycetota bacterium]|jgi:hypothetical protein
MHFRFFLALAAMLVPAACGGNLGGTSRQGDYENALVLAPAELAGAYESTKTQLGMARFAAGQSNITIVSRGLTINQKNAAAVRSKLEKRLAAYERAIRERGYEAITGQYAASATSACARTQSLWAGGIEGGMLEEHEISQDGFTVQLAYRLEYQGNVSESKVRGVVVESVLVFTDPINSDFPYIGDIRPGEIEVRPDADAVLAYWPNWARGPDRKDLRDCIVTLTPTPD